MIFKDRLYWESKYPQIEQVYKGRPVPGTSVNVDFDVRHFIWNDDIVLRRIINAARLQDVHADSSALNCQRYVVKALQYVKDTTLGSSEFWLFPSETLLRGKGDCEDGACLLASLLLNCLPIEDEWRVRVNAGYVQPAPAAPLGGHGYCVYCRQTDNEWVVLDWCYVEDSQRIVEEKILAKNNCYYKDVWFSFNNQHAWADHTFELKGRLH